MSQVEASEQVLIPAVVGCGLIESGAGILQSVGNAGDAMVFKDCAVIPVAFGKHDGEAGSCQKIFDPPPHEGINRRLENPR